MRGRSDDIERLDVKKCKRERERERERERKREIK